MKCKRYRKTVTASDCIFCRYFKSCKQGEWVQKTFNRNKESKL